MNTVRKPPFPVLPAVLVTGGSVLLFGAFLGCWFTAEDFTFIYLYHRMPFLELFTEPNLKAVVVSLYRPVTDLVIYLEAHLFGGTAWPWHAVNLVVHLANTWLLFRLGRRLSGPACGTAAALLYAWHPVLPGCFSFNVGGVQVGFLTLFTLLTLDRLAAFRQEGRRRDLAWSALFLFLALGSYEWFVLPVAVFLFDLAVPAGDRRPTLLRRCLQHLPYWAGLALWLAARKAVLGTWLGGYPLPPPVLWAAYFARIPVRFLASMEEFGFNPAVRELTPEWVRITGRVLFAAVAGAGLIRGVARHGPSFLRNTVLLLLALLAASTPVALVLSHDPASARRFLLPVAFLCLFTAYAACAAPRGEAPRGPGRFLPLAGVLLLAGWWGGLCLRTVPWYLEAGNLTRKIRDEVLACMEPDRDPHAPVFLLHTPMTLSVPFRDRPGRRAVAKVFQFGLGMAFSPPFSDRKLEVYPLNPDPVLGDALVSDQRVRMVSFTGGVEAGLHIVARAGLKKIGMELGSNSPVIVWSDADIGWAAETCVSGAFWAAGQNCIGVQRIYIHRDVYDRFRDLFVERTRAYKIGNKLDEATDMGPMITETEAKRVERWVAEARDLGATVLAGGGRTGALMEPTVLENVPENATIHHDEVFGPAVNLYPVDTLDEAIAKANSVDFGLHSAGFSNDVTVCHRMAAELDSGSVIINDSTDYRLDSMPFGGVKNSGLGKEGIRFSLQEMTEPKVISWYLPGV